VLLPGVQVGEHFLALRVIPNVHDEIDGELLSNGLEQLLHKFILVEVFGDYLQAFLAMGDFNG